MICFLLTLFSVIVDKHKRTEYTDVEQMVGPKCIVDLYGKWIESSTSPNSNLNYLKFDSYEIVYFI